MPPRCPWHEREAHPARSRSMSRGRTKRSRRPRSGSTVAQRSTSKSITAKAAVGNSFASRESRSRGPSPASTCARSPEAGIVPDDEQRRDGIRDAADRGEHPFPGCFIDLRCRTARRFAQRAGYRLPGLPRSPGRRDQSEVGDQSLGGEMGADDGGGAAPPRVQGTLAVGQHPPGGRTWRAAAGSAGASLRTFTCGTGPLGWAAVG